ncbi:hypothetical protein DTO164E3_6185 [Paecilomyces variotii]|nr:hypothetical protein DTO164E3_6185 [Paecilomyces variotii]KAJ9205183.1 hypothetical protein DTO032I3_2386 [Paecilomyces variotii]KAJ9280303.1 hypothetical protein DTO021D3_2891 [Paecilomyces variotii]KAJ9343117.1 hypothetical protein DTO027B6_4392 [Paecilomyces variotii]KAJ9359678.1 hypothetical protein DTO027B9_1726 [Paecilomyces variotii]
MFFARISPSRVPYLGQRISQRYLMSPTSQFSKEPLTLGTMLRSDSGRTYKIEEVLADRRKPLLCVYRASADGKDYIAKNMIQGEFEYQLNLQRSLSTCPNVRGVVDTVQEHEIFIYPFLSGDLLHIKPDNILVDYEESAEGGVIIKDVQISDLEDTVIVPPGKWLRGPLCGNAIWRSAESWCRSRQNQASDVFSFGIVMIYVMLNEMVFRVSDDQLKSADSWRYILRRHISYFADEDGLNGFLEHIGEKTPFYKRLIDLADSFGPGNPRQPFQRWSYVEPELRDLVGKMTNLDPTKRINAREALQHRWFRKTS